MYIVKDLTANMFCVSVYERSTSAKEAKMTLEKANWLFAKLRASYPDNVYKIQKIE